MHLTFSEDPLLWAFLLQQIYVLKYQSDNVVNML